MEESGICGIVSRVGGESAAVVVDFHRVDETGDRHELLMNSKGIRMGLQLGFALLVSDLGHSWHARLLCLGCGVV